ncbi:MAG: cyclic nucleotide-binding domain-containing protein [Desulfobacula sp.]|jgi:CRP/FNR family transcriptional regulator, cyclic AMP receptor protein|nr:cyclic nucleotide-binding domain-containing protein [Desulfobacula sp.]MBT6340174.1 cyclic nucleotide-binding domain-containing protein [Desulfobacula sp.]
MITVQDLKQFVMLGYLSDEMLKSLIPITEMLRFDENEIIFQQREKADRLFLLKMGKVLLEQRITDKMTVSMSSIKPGFSFGWSAMLENDLYSTDAICAEPCEVFSFRGSKIKKLMEQDHSLGFIISQRLLYVIKKRYDARTEQFVKTIKLHPDISNLL